MPEIWETARRSHLSCARCRQKKIKCDKKLPACSQCITAKATCAGVSSVAGGAVPRDLIQHLEVEIARLENEIIQNGGAESLATLDSSPLQEELTPAAQGDHGLTEHTVGTIEGTKDSSLPSIDPITQSIMASADICSIISATRPDSRGKSDLTSRIRTGLTPSPTNMRIGTADTRLSNVRIDSNDAEVPARVLASLPPVIMKNLVTKFVQRFISAQIVLREPDVWQQLEKVQRILEEGNAVGAKPNELYVPPDYDLLVIYLVLAISVTLDSFKGGHEARCMELSASLFNEGIRHLDKANIPDDLAGLQVTLLTLHYAIINPQFANVWILSGVAMRTCLELGLHREPPDTSMFHLSILEYRRCLFWAAYCIDRTICSALQLPLSIPDTSINTQLPLNAQKKQSRESMTGTTLPLLIQYHQLRSLILQVHFQGAPLTDGMEWEDWLCDIESKLRSWYGAYYRLKSDICELTDFEFAHTMAVLHRPSPRNPKPSDRSLLIAFEAAAASARLLKEDISGSFLCRRWLSAHHTLETAMIALFSLRHGAASIRAKFSNQQIFDITKLFTANFLSIAALGWTEAATLAGTYERLLAPTLDFILSKNVDPDSYFSLEDDAQLQRLLYPGQSHVDKLRFEVSTCSIDDASFQVSDLNRILDDFDPESELHMDVDSLWHERQIGCWDLLDRALATSIHVE